ncbi:MAG: hypothetical protein LBL94_06425 [Prevotellaceae bacterium]|jgi:hypothetical protein|nr:hypothetical protein [Prevotellaceae bacterium]
MKNESKVFGMYAAGSHAIRQEFGAPFTQNGYVYATDERILIRVRESAAKGAYTHSEKYGCAKLFNVAAEQEEVISARQLKKLLSEVELVEETHTVSETIKCEVCGGYGEVHWEYESWGKDDDCPACSGSGYTHKEKKIPAGKMITNESALVKLGNKTFTLRYIRVIAETMKLLGIATITMRYSESEPSRQAIFSFSPDVDVLLMPTLPD